MRNGDRVRVRRTGEIAVFIAERELPLTWWGGKPDPPRFVAFVEYPDGNRDLLGLADIEPVERKP